MTTATGRVWWRRVGSPPHHLVSNAGRWYLVAFDPERADWRTFRVDRMADLRPTRRPFVPRAALARRGDLPRPVLRERDLRHTARLAVDLPPDAVRAGVFATIPGEIEPRGPAACTVRLTAESVELVVQFIAAIATLRAPVTVEEMSEEVEAAVRELGRVLARWVGP